MIRDYRETRKGFVRIKATEDRLTEVRSENQEKLKKLELVSSPEYKEKLIREKLNMQKTDEFVVVLQGSKNKVIGSDEAEKELKNWEKWLEVLGITRT